METVRKPFQGVRNIVRFNWHFYAFGFIVLVVLAYYYFSVEEHLRFLLLVFAVLFFLPVLISLLVSYYVYDASGFYSLKWLQIPNTSEKFKILNINAGFDETSFLLQQKFRNSEIKMLDFYDEKKHTEISIKRARTIYPNSLETISVTTDSLPFEDHSIDYIFLIFAAHEIRNDAERIVFFKELNRVLKQNGKVIITEHLRDFPNFLAFNIGFFHFLPMKIWRETFENSQFKISKKIKINPFVTTFYLSGNGTSS
ncbi:class I SAM-dependent methyltransferase [Kaistella sp.]|uniref:class I SAM-dependent methyltransferase n=1 Tax=Kaistella sp. TaxID=2782235 RepID=UPI003C572EB5